MIFIFKAMGIFFFFLISNKNILLKEEKCNWSIQEGIQQDQVQIKSIKYKSPKIHEQKINHELKWKNDILTLQPNPEVGIAMGQGGADG